MAKAFTRAGYANFERAINNLEVSGTRAPYRMCRQNSLRVLLLRRVSLPPVDRGSTRRAFRR